jgi:histone deacetylase complex regulatory component SIN3
MSIRRTYEQILTKLKEERTGYDHQITDLQNNFKTKENDCKEFKQLVLDAKQAKNLSQLLVENTKLSVNIY